MTAINFPRHIHIRYTFVDNSFCKNFVYLYTNVYWVSFHYEILLRLFDKCQDLTRDQNDFYPTDFA